MILKDNSHSRKEVVSYLSSKNIECRPIVTGNFLKNKEVLRYFNYEVSDTLENAEYIDSNGFFVGNHQIDLRSEIEYLFETLQGF